MKHKRDVVKVGVISLGCPKNLVDTEKMLGRYVQAGHALTPDPEEADLLVVNTCGFIASAEEESRQAILDMAAIKARRPGVRLAVTGCLAQRHGRLLKEQIPAIDLIVGTHDTPDQPRHVVEPPGYQAQLMFAPLKKTGEGAPRVLTTAKHTSYLKIAEGCNNPCSFCIIPQLRGPFRSRTPEELMTEARALVRGGVRELNLVSQDTSLYGRDLSPRTSLRHLLTELETLSELQWIRLLYLYPTLIHDDLLDHVNQSAKVVPYWDIPLQHSHSAVLTRMKRAESGESVRRLVSRIRERVLDAAIRSTFIVGFPGESDDEFNDLYQFVAEFKLDHVGVFTYSDEVGSAAWHLPDKIPAQLAEERRHRIYALQQQISREKMLARVGTTCKVLVEQGIQEDPWVYRGRTQWQAPEVDGHVKLKGGHLVPGMMVSAKVLDATAYDLMAEVV
ncbi:MAG: 30S ribosomal protein S12 methylthiotransferase RimO [Magnetococcales bacterium]|nr:30S ribosomal protein S12 methylthiotransferase RimO [Magnetococcales bacterium]